MLLDVNNEPTNTVYYYAAAAYGCLVNSDGIDFSSLLEDLSKKLFDRKINTEFFSFWLNFLFLFDKIYIDDRGGLHVNKKTENS